MSRLIDTAQAGTIADAILDMLDEYGGYSPEEIIPGLIEAVIRVADNDDDLLNEASNFLADGGLSEET